MKPSGIKTIDWYHYNILFFIEHWLGYSSFKKHFGVRQTKLFNKIDKYLALAGAPTGQVLDVETADKDITTEDFLKICFDGPKVFKGAAKNWTAIKKWNLDFFEENYGDEEIIIMDNIGLTNNQYEKMSFRTYIQQLRVGTHKYLKFSDFVNDNKELKNDFDLPWLDKIKQLPFSWGEDARFFMGDKKSFTPLHVGFSNFFFITIVGKKKWIFYKTNERIFLDARTERTSYLFSKANPYDLNDPNFPLLKYATRYEVILEPGDIIWVPSYTWHYVENPTLAIALRYGRGSMVTAPKASKMFTLLMFLATKPFVLEHFFISRTKKRESIYLKSQSDLDRSVFERLNIFKRRKTGEPNG